MSESIYIAVVGFAKSGKSAVVTNLCERYGFTAIRPSQIIGEELRKEFPGQQAFTRAQLRAKGEELRKLYGPAYYLDTTETTNGRVLIDGPRHMSSVRAIAERGGFTIGVVAREEVRFKRAEKSTDKLVPPTIQEFRADEQIELNDISGNGGQILPILWSTAPEDIIDTSDITISATFNELDLIMGRHGLTTDS